jgi:hypothetical protein
MFSYREYRAYRRWRRHQQRRAVFFIAITATLVAVLLYAAGAHAGHQAKAPAAKHVSSLRQARRHRRVHHVTAAKPGPGTAGAGLSWVDFYGIQLPVSAHDGPRHQHHGIAWGFTDTPRGALLAAVNIGVRTAAQWGPNIYGPTIGDQVTGPDKAALLAADASDYAALRAATGVRDGRPAGRGYAAEAGYRFIAYTPAAATVDIVSQGPGTSGTSVLAATRLQVLWQHGDWRLLAPPGGDWASSATAITSLAGYTAFTPEG